MTWTWDVGEFTDAIEAPTMRDTLRADGIDAFIIRAGDRFFLQVRLTNVNSLKLAARYANSEGLIEDRGGDHCSARKNVARRSRGNGLLHAARTDRGFPLGEG